MSLVDCVSEYAYYECGRVGVRASNAMQLPLEIARNIH